MARRETARVKQLGKMYSIEGSNGTGGWKLEYRLASARRLKDEREALELGQ